MQHRVVRFFLALPDIFMLILLMKKPFSKDSLSRASFKTAFLFS